MNAAAPTATATATATASDLPSASTGPGGTGELRAEATAALRRLVGREDVDFRDGQWEAVRALVQQRARALVVQRTGWGKSAVYFVATALLRARGAGPTLIVSPLLALMRDQVAAAQRAGVRAASINSANAEEWASVAHALDAGEVDVLLVSPERLNNPRFREEQLPALAAGVGLLVVDEAHCVSDWGHDFRPDYRRIRDLLRTLPAGTPVLATTATANARVVDDVGEQLAVGPGGSPLEVVTTRGPLARASLRLGVLRLPDPQTRLAWLAEHLPELPGSGIVYCLTVAAAQDVAAFLTECGLAVRSYTGQTDPAERPAVEQALRDNQVKALVATSALGMGFDKPDLGFVVHLGSPASPIAYYQQVGRAGRATASADVLLLPGAEDRDIWRYLASVSMPRQEQAEAVLDRLGTAGRPLSTAALETAVDVRRTRLELLLKVLDVEGAVQRVGGGWVATGQPWTYDAARYERVAQARAREQQAMLDYLALAGPDETLAGPDETPPGPDKTPAGQTASCRMEFLARQLDDPWAAPCGRCDTCAGAWYPVAVGEQAQDAARARLARVGVELEPRAQWPTGMDRLGVPVKGRIPEQERPATGRAVARLSDLGTGARLRALVGPGTGDGEVPDDVVDACVAVLKDWGWQRRPSALAWVPSRTRPRLLASLATRLAALGRLQLLGALEPVDGGPTGGPGGNSAFRLAGVWDRLQVPEEWASQLSAQPGPVLLLDDVADSRWTLTVAARRLRLAGADAVLPLVLGSAG